MSSVPFSGESPFQDLPDPAKGHRSVILTAKQGRPCGGVILSRRFVGVKKHFFPAPVKRSFLCWGSDCRYCPQLKELPVWAGYLCVLTGNGRRHLMQLTAECVRMDERLKDPQCDLRGYRIALDRLGTSSQGVVRARWSSDDLRVPLDKLPPPIDIHASLKAVFGIREDIDITTFLLPKKNLGREGGAA